MLSLPRLGTTLCAALLASACATTSAPPTAAAPPAAVPPPAAALPHSAPPSRAPAATTGSAKPVAAVAAAAAPAASPDPKVLGVWKIEQARAAPLLHKLNARLSFGTDGQLSGNGGCNNVSAPYTLEANTLRLGRLVATRKACDDVLMEQEDRVLTALERAVAARVPGHGLLELLDADGTVLLRGSRLPAKE